MGYAGKDKAAKAEVCREPKRAACRGSAEHEGMMACQRKGALLLDPAPRFGTAAASTWMKCLITNAAAQVSCCELLLPENVTHILGLPGNVAWISIFGIRPASPKDLQFRSRGDSAAEQE